MMKMVFCSVSDNQHKIGYSVLVVFGPSVETTDCEEIDVKSMVLIICYHRSQKKYTTDLYEVHVIQQVFQTDRHCIVH